MHCFRFVTLIAFAVFAIASAASAADLPHKAPAYIPPPAPVYNWTGFYVGLHAGYGWMRSDTSLDALFNGIPTSFASVDAEEIPDRFRIDTSGFIGGGQAGVNYQINRALIGIEADLSYSGIKGDSTISGSVTSGGPPVTQPFLSVQSQDLKWLATVRGRLGYLPTDSLLLYATGGLAIGRLEESHRLQFLGVGGTTYVGSDNSTRSGWTVGAGAEYRISGNWTAKLEYLYFDLGSTTVIATDVASPGNPFKERAQFDHTGQIARAGVNYKFW
jgi:outer membrane immunogenic protein